MAPRWYRNSFILTQFGDFFLGMMKKPRWTRRMRIVLMKTNFKARWNNSKMKRKKLQEGKIPCYFLLFFIIAIICDCYCFIIAMVRDGNCLSWLLFVIAIVHDGYCLLLLLFVFAIVCDCYCPIVAIVHDCHCSIIAIVCHCYCLSLLFFVIAHLR